MWFQILASSQVTVWDPTGEQQESYYLGKPSGFLELRGLTLENICHAKPNHHQSHERCPDNHSPHQEAGPCVQIW